MTKQKDASQTAMTTVYDDTGRTLQTLKVQKLLDKAKRVIAFENKKAHKERMKVANIKGMPSMSSTDMNRKKF